jgi:hypothetical protein
MKSFFIVSIFLVTLLVTTEIGFTVKTVAQSKPISTETPKPEWVPDPRAGHYDCPDGWTAFSSSEPEIPRTFANLIYSPQPKDKKGHLLGVRPAPGICIQDSK